jgi:hypothetical protein
MAPIHLQVRARHEATRITYQEYRRAPILSRLAQPSQHILRRPIRLAIRILDEQLLHHSRDDIPWRNCVDANIVLAPFGSEIAAKLDDAGFGCIVRGADEALERTCQ